MSDAPERIWLRYDKDSTEYRRADLPRPEDAARIDALEERLGITRMCVACGKVRISQQGREAPGDGCATPDACTWDMTPQEAADHWRKLAHDRSARIAALEAALRLAISIYDAAHPWRTADWHGESCDCERCKVDAARATLQPKE